MYCISMLARLLLLCCGLPSGALPAQGHDVAPVSDWRVLFLCSPRDAHPRGTHEYEAAARLLAHALTQAPQIGKVAVEVAAAGWPADPAALHAADTIVVITAGADQDPRMHPLLDPQRWSALEAEMARGCGLVVVHWACFVPREPQGGAMLDWVGAHFDYESGPAPRHWASAIQTCEAQVDPVSAAHPTLRGVTPFAAREEWYYRLRSASDAHAFTPLLEATIPGEAQAQVVACARERAGGGRGVMTSGGHFLANYRGGSFARFLLNAVTWTAQREVPIAGVSTAAIEPIEAWIVGGDQHPAHALPETNLALREALERDPRFDVRIITDLEQLAELAAATPQVLIWNHCNWNSSKPSSQACARLESWLGGGGGLVLMHFGNSAFHPSLPQHLEADAWPFWHRHVSRRAWDHHGFSGHDAYGAFEVSLTALSHPVTQGLQAWNTTDELYYRQVGAAPIEPLLVARSRDTNRSEPLAWSHSYESGRIFQTLLGHDAASLRNPGTAALVRRAASWCARRTLRDELDRPLDTLPRGPVGVCLDGNAGRVQLEFDAALARDPFTVDVLVRLAGVPGHHVFVSRESKASGTHWELYADAVGGVLSAYLPGYEPSIVRSAARVNDDQWHALAMQCDGQQVVLYRDGVEVLRQSVQRTSLDAIPGPLWLAGAVAPDHEVGCAALIDELCLRRGIHAPLSFDAQRAFEAVEMLGHWSFEMPRDASRDALPGDFESPAAWTPPYRAGDPESEREEDWLDARFQRMDTGPFLTTAVETPRGRVARGLALRLGREREASMLFDLARLEMRAAWRGRFLEHAAVRFGLLVLPKLGSEPQFATQPGTHHILAREDGRWHGLELHGERVLLDYELQGRRIAEAPWTAEDAELLIYERRFEVDSAQREIQILLDQCADAGWEPMADLPEGSALAWKRADEVRAFLRLGSQRAVLRSDGAGSALLVVPPADESVGVAVWAWRGPTRDFAHVLERARGTSLRFDLRAEWQSASAPRWQVLETAGRRGDDTAAFAVDEIRLPFANPWGALLFCSGVAFLPNGDAVVCTAHGDVWTVRGLDRDLAHLRWQRFATGLFQPLGIAVRDEQIFVLGRDQLTRLIDRDGDGEADQYQNFCNMLEDRGEPHAYAMDLVVDAAGNFYFQKSGGNGTAHGSSTLRIAADGSSIEVLAYGFRHANGIGIGPDGVLTNADNQGDWIPATRINWLYKPAFHGGYVPGFRGSGDPQAYDPPLCWIPHAVDNSAGGQVWVPDSRWGLPAHSLLHTSFGRCRLFLVLHELVDAEDGMRQGGVVPLEPIFASGICRARFHPIDGSLYVAGLEGWQTAARADGCLQRVRRTSHTLGVPLQLTTTSQGLTLQFSAELDPTSVRPSAFEVERWNYRYSGNYGSDEWSLEQPERRGRDRVRIAEARLHEDGRTLELRLATMLPCMQQRVSWELRAADGSVVVGELFHTIHRVPR